MLSAVSCYALGPYKDTGFFASPCFVTMPQVIAKPFLHVKAQRNARMATELEATP